MGAHGWTYFVVLVVLFVSLSGKRIRKPKIMSEGKAVVVKINNNAGSLGHIKKIETELNQIKKRLESLDNKVTSLVSSSGSRKLFHYFYLSFFFSVRKVIHTYTYIYILFTLPCNLQKEHFLLKICCLPVTVAVVGCCQYL